MVLCVGFNHYYNTYDDLRIHYRKEHFLCEEENCAEEKFTSVFRTDIDLKGGSSFLGFLGILYCLRSCKFFMYGFPAHLASAHSRLLGKHGMKQARTLDIEFGLPKRPENERGRFGRPFGARGRDHEKVDRRFARYKLEFYLTFKLIKLIKLLFQKGTETMEDFVKKSKPMVI